MKIFLLSPTVCLLLLISCAEKGKLTDYYYPIDSLMHAQALYLADAHATLIKKASIDGKEETVSFVPKDTSAWMYELDVFTELRTINKPINIGSYHVEKGVRDRTSNLQIYSITSTKKLPVEYLNVYYLNQVSDIRKIEALYHEESSLMKASRMLTLEFQNIHNKIVLTSYSIEGGQKMLLGDSVTFSVKGMVTL